MILDWSYNYRANNMYQQVAPIEIMLKTKQTTKQNKKQEQQQNNNNKTTTLQPTNNLIYICVCIHTDN